jgi:hypothetical protein
MRYRLIATVSILAVAAFGCGNHSARRNYQQGALGSTGIPGAPGGRCAAVLMSQTVSGSLSTSGSGYISPYNQTGGAKPILNGSGNGTTSLGGQRSGTYTTTPSGDIGIVEIVNLNMSQAMFTRSLGTYAPLYQGVTNGMAGSPSGFTVALQGINPDKSHIAWSTDGSLIYVTATAIG